MKTFLTQAGRLFKQPTVAKLLGWLMAGTALALGVSMIVGAAAYMALPSFQLSASILWGILTPPVWGVAYLIIGTVVAVFVTVDRSKAVIPLIVLCGVHVVMCGLAINSVVGGYTAAQSIFFFSTAVTCLITQLSCAEDSR